MNYVVVGMVILFGTVGGLLTIIPFSLDPVTVLRGAART